MFFVLKKYKIILTKLIGKHNAKFTKNNTNVYITPISVINSINALIIKIYKKIFHLCSILIKNKMILCKFTSNK